MVETIYIGVYIKTNHNNEIVAVNSDVFITDQYNWIKIDEGYGDRYAHAQSQYFSKNLIDEFGKYNYKYLNGRIYEV